VTTSDSLRTRLAAELRQAAEATGDGRFAVAAGILRGRAPGRRRRDDAAAVAEIAALLAAKFARTPTEAARLVAKSRREVATVESVTRQLAAAYRRIHIGK
jgi:hypothetical protein